MAYREVHGVEIQEIIRRWQAGLSQRRIASGTGLSRVTVRRYVEAAEAAGLTPGGPEPSEEQLAALATLSLSGPRQVEAPSEELLSPWAEQIERWLETDRLQLTRIQELLAGRGCEVSYTTLRRFIRRRGWRHRLPSTVRMDDGPPGEVAEMDFGRLGFIRDPESGRRRAVWALVVVWRYSRHCFVWPTTSQKLDAVIEGLEEAWAFSWSPESLVCGATYTFHVEARGDGETYTADWGLPETRGVVTTGCELQPVFGSSDYEFSVAEGAEVGTVVGQVAATPDADLSYAITDGNAGGAFAIGAASGEITLAGTLDSSALSSYTLAVRASDGRGGVATATVLMTIVE